MRGEKRSAWFKRWLAVILLASGGVGVAWYYQEHSPTAGRRYQTSAVSRGEVLQMVTASGQLNPVKMVDVGSQISGIIQELLVDFNSTVKAGQLVAKIDPRTFEANYIEAQGDLSSAKAALELAQLEERRAKALRESSLNPQAEYDRALVAMHQAEATVKIKEGALKNAEVSLARCSIYAPIDGVIVGMFPWAFINDKGFFADARTLKKKEGMYKSYRGREFAKPPKPTGKEFPIILNTEELATLWHLPGLNVSAPLVPRVQAKKGQPPSILPTR